MVKRRLNEWRNDLRMIRERGTFARNAAYAFGGSAVITISQVVLTPFVARIYGPEAYGIYGIFITICLNLAAIAEMGISSAFVLPQDEEKARDLLRANILALMLILLLMVPFLVFREEVYRMAPSWRSMGAWYYAIPLGTVVQMVPTMLTKWLTRYKEFGRGAAINGGTNLVLRVFNVVYGLLSKGALHGLIVGELIVRGASVPFLIGTMAPHGAGRLLAKRPLCRIWSTVKEYRRYPLFIFPGRYVSLLGQQAPIFLLASDPIAVGQFAFATALLLMPLRLIGYSLSSVFQQKAVETYRNDPNALGPLTRRFQERLFLIGLVPFAVIAFFGDLGFSLVLGEEWRISGIYAGWMSLYFMLRLLSEPIISLLNVLGREQDMLSIHGGLLVIRILGIVVGLYVIGSVHVAVLLYVMISTIGYGGLLAHLYKLVSIVRWRAFGRMLLVFCIASFTCCAVRYFIVGEAFPLI